MGPGDATNDGKANANGSAAVVALTQLSSNAAAGDRSAAAELLPLVYEELRRLAGQKMRGERAGHTLQATALVHEAYVRLTDRSAGQRWEGRWQFFAAAAESMQRILVEQARRRGRLKCGGVGGSNAVAWGKTASAWFGSAWTWTNSR
jgi:RNA polymerase sigma factor (TIGR02999 family)